MYALAVPLVFTFLLVPPIVRRLYFFPSSIAGTVDKVVKFYMCTGQASGTLE